MDLLSVSSSSSSSSIQLFAGNLHLHSLFKTKSCSFKPQVSIPSCSQSSLGSLVTTSATSSRNLNMSLEARNPTITFQLSATELSSAPEVDPMNLLLRERIVFLGNEITDFVADAICTQLLLLDAKDPTKDIRLFINSPGGSTSAAMAVFDVVQHVRADVSTIALGVAASTAAFVLGGGTKGKRFAMPNSRIMLHQPQGGASGDVPDVEVQAKEVMSNKRNMIRIMSEYTGHPLEKIEKDIEWDFYMSPMEALEYGMIDGVIDRDNVIPLVPDPETVKPTFD